MDLDQIKAEFETLKTKPELTSPTIAKSLSQRLTLNRKKVEGAIPLAENAAAATVSKNLSAAELHKRKEAAQKALAEAEKALANYRKVISEISPGTGATATPVEVTETATEVVTLVPLQRTWIEKVVGQSVDGTNGATGEATKSTVPTKGASSAAKGGGTPTQSSGSVSGERTESSEADPEVEELRTSAGDLLKSLRGRIGDDRVSALIKKVQGAVALKDKAMLGKIVGVLQVEQEKANAEKVEDETPKEEQAGAEKVALMEKNALEILSGLKLAPQKAAALKEMVLASAKAGDTAKLIEIGEKLTLARDNSQKREQEADTGKAAAEKAAAEKAAAEKAAAEKAAAEKAAAEKAAAEKAAAEKAAAEKAAAEKAAAEKAAAEKAAAEKAAAEKAAAEKVAAEKVAAEKAAAEKAAAEKAAAEKAAAEKVAAEKAAAEKAAAEKAAAEKAAAEKAAAEKAAAEKAAAEKVAAEKAAAEKVAAEKAAAEKVAAEKAAAEKAAAEKAAAEKAAAEKAAAEKAAAEKAAAEKAAAEKAAAEKAAAEKAAAEKAAAEKAAAEKAAAEKAAAEKAAAEKAAAEKAAAEKAAVKPATSSEAEQEAAAKTAVELTKKLATKFQPAEIDALKTLTTRNPKFAASVASVLDELAGPGLNAPVRMTAKEADAAIKAAAVKAKDEKEKAEAAIDEQLGHIAGAASDLFEKLQKLRLNLPEFSVDSFNQRTDEAYAKFNTHAPGAHAAAVKDLQDLYNEMKAKSPEAAKAAAGMDNFKNFTTENRKQLTAEKAVAQAETARANAEKAKATTALLDAVRFGPLSRPLPPETDPEVTAAREKAATDIIGKFKDHPATAYDALELVRGAKHPAVIAKGVDVAGKLRNSNFASTKDGGWSTSSAKMTRNALAMGGLLGGDYFEEMEAYYANDSHAGDDPLQPAEDSGGKTKGTAYTKQIVADLVGEDGSLNFAADGLKPTVNNLKFHPRSLQSPLFALTANLEEIRQKFTDPPGETNEYVKTLGAVKKPASGGDGDKAKRIVRDCLGLPGDQEPTAADTKRAVMSAMLTPFAQGDVGSCFATGPCLKFKEADPLAYMADLGKIVETGTLAKGGRPALPVITNLPDATKENPLMRSWEYTVTTMGARKEKSFEKKRLTSALFGDSTKKSLANLGPEHKSKIKNAVRNAFTFDYDPISELPGLSADGSSSKGNWGLKGVNGDGVEDEITTEDAFLEHLRRTVDKELDLAAIPEIEEGLDPDVKLAQEAARKKKLELKAKLDDLFGGADKLDFVTQLRAGFDEGRGAPWAMSGGGRGEGPAEILFGKGVHGEVPERKQFFSPAASGPHPTGFKEGALLSNMVKELQGVTTKHVTVSVTGIHGMNLVPNHPSLAALQPDSGKTIEEKVREQLILPGVEIAKRKTKEQTASLHGKAVASVLGSIFDDDPVISGLNPPTAGKTPAELKAYILGQVPAKISEKVAKEMEKDPEKVEKAVQKKVDAMWAKHSVETEKIDATNKSERAKALKKHKDAWAKYDADWEAYEADPSNVPEPTAPPNQPNYPLPTPYPDAPTPDTTALEADYKNELEESYKKYVANGVDNVLMKELAPPEFVIADTNWGNQTGRTFHVIATDPCTGAPALWKKEDPSGDYSREAEEWLTKDWSVMKKGAEYT